MDTLKLCVVFLLICTSRFRTCHAVSDPRGSDHNTKYDATDGPSADGTNESSHSNDSGHVSLHLASFRFDYVSEPFIIAAFVIFTGLAKLGFHHADFLVSVLPESCLLIIVGTVAGGIIVGIQGESPENHNFQTHLDPKTFFLFLLPPIILEASYSLHDRVFFDNFGSIMVYAVLGTIIACFTVGPALYGLAISGAMGGGKILDISFIQCLVFSSLIVAVDPVAVLAIFQEVHVNNVLYFLVFGESLFNDAVTVVIYNTVKGLNQMDLVTGDQISIGIGSFFIVSLGGTAVGLLFGCITSVFTKYTQHVRVVEPLAVFSIAYLSYLTAEMFHFSGIISIIFCGLVQAQYAFHNLSNKSLITVKYFTKMMSTSCDSIIFLFLGFALVRYWDHEWHTGFILWSILICLIVRCLVTYSLTYILNKITHRSRQITLKEQFIMAYGGLRGAVCFSLVTMLDERFVPYKKIFQTATLSVIIFTVFIQGITIKPFVKLLDIKRASNDTPTMCETVHTKVTDHVMAGVEEILGKFGKNMLREWTAYFDDRYLRHWFQRNPSRNDEHIMELYEKIALREHYANLYGEQAERKLEDAKKGIPTTHSVAQGLSMMFGAGSWNGAADQLQDLNLERARDENLRPPMAKLRQLSLDESLAQANAHRVEPGSPPPSASRLRRRVTGRRESLSVNPTAIEVKQLLDSGTPSHVGYHRKHDRNLTRDHHQDLLTQLQNKSERTSRLVRSLSQSATPPFNSACSSPGVPDMRSASLEAIPEEVFRSRMWTESAVPRTLIEREKARQKVEDDRNKDVNRSAHDHRLDAMNTIQERAMETLMEDTLAEHRDSHELDVFTPDDVTDTKPKWQSSSSDSKISEEQDYPDSKISSKSDIPTSRSSSRSKLRREKSVDIPLAPRENEGTSDQEDVQTEDKPLISKDENDTKC